MTKTVAFNNDTGKDDEDKAASAGNARWWDKKLPKTPKDSEPPPQVHGELVPYVQDLMVAWGMHDFFDRCHDRIYENKALLSVLTPRTRQALSNVGVNPSRLMVTTGIVDTFCSRFERRRPMPMIAVDDADYDTKEQAAEFQAAVRGQVRNERFGKVRARVIKDACVRGSGIAYVDEGDDDLIIERVHRWELFIDPHEAEAGPDAVRQIHRVRRVAREVLEAEFPEHAEAIRKAPAARAREHEGGRDEWASPVASWKSPDMIDLYESWHLPSLTWSEDDDPEAADYVDDGRTAMCIEGATLCFERWERPRFPFGKMNRHERQSGYWGQGDVERLQEDQADINRIARDIQRNVEMDGNLKVFTPQAMDNVPTEKLTGRGPMRIRYPGSQPPAYVPPNPVSQAHLSYLQFRISHAHDSSGVPQWTAQARSPVGAGASGAAIDTMEDVYSDRHAGFEAEDARWVCTMAQLIIDAYRAMAKRRKQAAEGKKKRLLTVALEGRTLRRIDFNTVALKDEQYQIGVEPVSWVPDSIPGKLARLKEMSGLQLWSAIELLELYEVPDLAASTRELLAPLKLARKIMRDIGDKKKPVPMPEPLWDLELHKKLAIAGYQLAQVDNANDEVVARFRDYVDLVQDEIDKAKKGAAQDAGGAAPADPMAAAAGMPPPDGMPPMDPGAPPTDLSGPPTGLPMPPPPLAA